MTIPLLPEKHRKNTQLFFIAFSSFAFVAMAWMFLFNIDIISNAEGQVIPAGDVKTIQHLEGGIIDQILVKESDTVKAGESLVILAATASEVDVDEAQVQIDSKTIQSIRLEAEINNFDIPVFPDELVNKRELTYDWEWLRKEIKEYGLRHSTLSAQMPSESSSVVSNATNGIEPPRDYLSVKKSKKGPLKQIVPEYNKLKNFYTLLWEMKGNEGYINIVAVMQKYFDQAISGNWSYNPENYTDGQVPVSVMAQDLLTTYKLGWKTSYYQNTYDSKKDEDEPSHPIGWQDNVPETNKEDDPENCDSCTI